jgi:hypothetical protein
MLFPIYKGNRPANVRKAAKYQVRSRAGGFVVAIIYEADEGERWYPSTDKHPVLLNMVNAVKTTHGIGPGGNFYINEFHQVIVPVPGGSREYYLAGEYREPLRFEFEGKIISGEPIDLEERALAVGNKWVGPHAGIPYTLAAGGNDIYYTYSPRPNVEKTVKLSAIIGQEKAADVARPIQVIKGHSGGRFYVNEFGSIFAPVHTGNRCEYLYVGHLGLDLWFDKPSCV